MNLPRFWRIKMFRNKDLSVLVYSNGFSLWQYYAGDSLEKVEVDGYFDKVKHLCATGDIIIIVAKGQVGKETAIRSILLEDGVVKLKQLV